MRLPAVRLPRRETEVGYIARCTSYDVLGRSRGGSRIDFVSTGAAAPTAAAEAR